MFTKFLSKTLSYESGRGKLLPLVRERYFLCVPIKNYPFLRSAATVPSEVGRKNGASVAESPGSIIPFRRNYFIKYFLNQEEYRSLVVDPYNLNFKTEGKFESVDTLKNLIDDSENEELLDKLKYSLLKEKENLDVEEICKFLFWTYQHKEKDLAQEIVNLLETELLSRKLTQLERIKVLLTLKETWGKVNKRSYLEMKFIYKIVFKMRSLSPKQIVAFFSCNLNFSKAVLRDINYNVTDYVTNIIPSLDAVELGIIATGLLCGNFSCDNFALKQNFFQRALELSGSIDESSLFAICKFLRENVSRADGANIVEFQERLIPHLSKYKYKKLNSLLLIGIKIGCLNLNLWEKVANMYKENINNCDFNGLLSMVTILTQCDVDDEEFLKLVTEKFERAVEDGTIDYSDNRKNLILFLNNLIHHRMYPKKLLDVVFAEGLTFFKPGVKYGSNVQVKYWETKCFLDIDKPEFNYNSFSEEEASKLFKLSKYCLNSMKSLASFHDSAYYALKTMRRILVDSYKDDEAVHYSAWHPVYSKGLFLRFDQNLNAQPIPADFKSLKDDFPKRALKDNHIWVFVSLVPAECCFGTEKIKRIVLTQIRHLQAFGYKPVLIPYWLFKRHEKRETANEYVNNLINEQLHKTSWQK